MDTGGMTMEMQKPKFLENFEAKGTQKCDPDNGIHFHGEGDTCQCGARSNAWVENEEDS